jgi:hypothetical protein
MPTYEIRTLELFEGYYLVEGEDRNLAKEAFLRSDEHESFAERLVSLAIEECEPVSTERQTLIASGRAGY